MAVLVALVATMSRIPGERQRTAKVNEMESEAEHRRRTKPILRWFEQRKYLDPIRRRTKR